MLVDANSKTLLGGLLMFCPKCDETFGPGIVKCHFCGVVLLDRRPAAPEEGRSSTTAALETVAPREDAASPIGTLIGVAVVIVVILLFLNYARPDPCKAALSHGYDNANEVHQLCVLGRTSK